MDTIRNPLFYKGFFNLSFGHISGHIGLISAKTGQKLDFLKCPKNGCKEGDDDSRTY